MNTGEFWLSAVAAAVVAVVLGELIDVAAWLALRIIRRASAHMPTPELEARYYEEWQAELDQLDGLKLIKLVKATALWVNSWRISSAWQSNNHRFRAIARIRLFAMTITLISKVAWTGQPAESAGGYKIAEGGNPEMMLPLFFMLIMAHFKLSVILRVAITDIDSGKSRTEEVALGKKNTSVNYARGAAFIIRGLSVIFYDLYLLRSGTRLRELRSRNASAIQAISF